MSYAEYIFRKTNVQTVFLSVNHIEGMSNQILSENKSA